MNQKGINNKSIDIGKLIKDVKSERNMISMNITDILDIDNITMFYSCYQNFRKEINTKNIYDYKSF